MKALTKAQIDEMARFSQVIGEATEFFADLADNADAYYDERSEKWRESDAASAYDDWKQALRQAADDCSSAAGSVDQVAESPG